MPKKLPRIKIIEIEELEPQVRITFEIEDDEAVEALVKMAYRDLGEEGVQQVVLEEFLRRALLESVKILEKPKKPAKKPAKKIKKRR